MHDILLESCGKSSQNLGIAGWKNSPEKGVWKKKLRTYSLRTFPWKKLYEISSVGKICNLNSYLNKIRRKSSIEKSFLKLSRKSYLEKISAKTLEKANLKKLSEKILEKTCRKKSSLSHEPFFASFCPPSHKLQSFKSTELFTHWSFRTSLEKTPWEKFIEEKARETDSQNIPPGKIPPDQIVWKKLSGKALEKFLMKKFSEINQRKTVRKNSSLKAV